jgi:hypothetical protein
MKESIQFTDATSKGCELWGNVQNLLLNAFLPSYNLTHPTVPSRI